RGGRLARRGSRALPAGPGEQPKPGRKPPRGGGAVPERRRRLMHHTHRGRGEEVRAGEGLERLRLAYASIGRGYVGSTVQGEGAKRVEGELHRLVRQSPRDRESRVGGGAAEQGLEREPRGV